MQSCKNSRTSNKSYLPRHLNAAAEEIVEQLDTDIVLCFHRRCRVGARLPARQAVDGVEDVAEAQDVVVQAVALLLAGVVSVVAEPQDGRSYGRSVSGILSFRSVEDML